MKYVSHTIYDSKKPTVGITFKPTRNLSYAELSSLMNELQIIKEKMWKIVLETKDD